MTLDGPSANGPAGRLRVGHAERDAVAAVLQEAAADGRLEMAELEERLDTALRARTYAELEPVVADLAVDLPWRPGQPQQYLPQHLPQHQPQDPSTRPGPPLPGYSRDDPLRFDGGVSSDKRDGRWLVPPFVRINSGVGTVKLNCLEATTRTGVIEVEVVAGAGSVVIIVPEGWAANDDRLGKSFGSKSIKVPREPAPGSPLLVLSGNVGMGSFKIRPGSNRELRRLGAGPR